MSIRINRVYTRSGDDGQTAVIGGERVFKSHPRVTASGEIDELNSLLGICCAQAPEACSGQKETLLELQQQLFDLGSQVATPPEAHYPQMWKAAEKHIVQLEKLCDAYGEKLPELESFILPGGDPYVASLHHARTVARRAERALVSLIVKDKKDADAEELLPLKFLNRLSDLLFNMARAALRDIGAKEILWVKESERGI